MHPATNGGKDIAKGGMNFQYLIDLGTWSGGEEFT
jgi:hypothetical protein